MTMTVDGDGLLGAMVGDALGLDLALARGAVGVGTEAWPGDIMIGAEHLLTVSSFFLSTSVEDEKNGSFPPYYGLHMGGLLQPVTRHGKRDEMLHF